MQSAAAGRGHCRASAPGRRGETEFADRLAVLLHRTLTTDGSPPGQRIPGLSPRRAAGPADRVAGVGRASRG